MKLNILSFLVAMLLVSEARAQIPARTDEWADNGKYHIFIKGDSFNNQMITIDSLTNDTLEYDRQISRNRSLSIVYENNKPKYRIYCKAYYNKQARATRRGERRHNFKHVLRKLHLIHFTCFFPVYYYSKSARITGTDVFTDGKWESYKGDKIEPRYALFESYYVTVGGVRAKF